MRKVILRFESRKSLYSNLAHIVIGLIDYNNEKGSFTAPLIIPEKHPYFFDHTLDHVPGILLLEGIFQLFKIAALDEIDISKDQEIYINKLKISFNRWCEKDMPVMVELTPKADKSSLLGRFIAEGRVVQNEHIICCVDIEGEFITANSVLPPSISSLGSDSYLPLPELKFLHKRQRENVLVSTLRSEKDGGYSCNLLQPPKGHIFADRKFSFYSMTYILETTRQFAMLLAHKIGELPLDMAIILLNF